MSESVQSFFVDVELRLHVAMASKGTEVVQNILTCLDCLDGTSKLNVSSAVIRMSGSTKPFETVPAPVASP